MKSTPFFLAHRLKKPALAVAAALGLSSTAGFAVDYTWGFNAPGLWSDSTGAAGWNAGGAYPNAIGDSANLTFNITAATQVTLDVNAIVGTINLNDTGGGTDSAWTIAGGNSLTFDVSSGNATLSSAGATNSILTSIVLNDTVDVTTTNNLNIGDANTAAVISGTGGLNKLGAGLLTLSGTSANTYSGLTTVSSGTLALAKTGSNAIAGNLSINGGGVSMTNGNQIADTATVTVNSGGSWTFGGAQSETIANLNLSGGGISMAQAASGVFTVTGASVFSSGTFTIITGNNKTVKFGALTTSGGVINPSAFNTSGRANLEANSWTIENIASGTYIPLAFKVNGSQATQFALAGNLTFNRDSGNVNANSVIIDQTGAGTGIPSINLASGDHDFTIADGQASSDLVIKPRLVGTGANVNKKGAGTLELLDGVSTYTGSTTVTAGTLLVSGTGSINSTSGVTVTGGTFRYTSSTGLNRAVTVNGGSFFHNSSVNYSGALTFTSGTLGGTNLDGVSLTGANAIGAGKVLSPGNSPGTLAVDNVAFEDGGSYLWEINRLVTQGGTQGGDPGWDWINGAGGSLSLSSLSANGFTLRIDSLGSLTDWDTNGTYSWTIASFDSISGFNPANIFLNTSAFSDQNDISGGSFSLQVSGNDLVLSYTAIPEPHAAMLILGGFGVVAFLRRARRQG